MKKILSLVLTIFLIFCMAQTVFAREGDVTIAGAVMCPAVVLPEDPAPWQANAAAILRQVLSQVTGYSGNEVSDAKIFLDDPSVQPPSEKDGAYRIVQRGGDVYISGAGMRGTLYGVFGFLEEICGCRWYAADTNLIPQADAVQVPSGYMQEYTPFFEYCETDWAGWHDLMFSTANRMNGLAYRGIVPQAWGGGVGYLSAFAHTLTTQFCASDVYFQDHPEYFALHQGARTPNQLCLTNPDTIAVVTQEVLALLAQRHNAEDALQIVSLTQHDNTEFCTCDACKALDERNGSHAGSMITFVNAVADAVREAGYDNVAIDTFAYRYTRQAPTHVVPRDNVIVRLCSIECCFGHTMDDPGCAQNAAFMADLDAWSRICGRIYIWDYGTNYSETIHFFPNFNVLQRNMQIFHEHNVLGVYGEGNYYIDRCDGEFGALRNYLQCRLMADPYMDFDAQMNGFLRAYYGDGWPMLRTFINLCCEKSVTANRHAGIYDRSKGSLPALTSADVRRCDDLWQKAVVLAETETQRAHVLRSQLCWRYWKASNSRREFSILRLPFARMQARDALYRDMLSFGIQSIGEGTRLRDLSACPALHLLRIPFCWTTLYDNAFWNWISPLVEKIYGLWTLQHPV